MNPSEIVSRAHQLWSTHAPYRHVIDATVGNGHDSLFLAPLSARIDGIDIQPLAIRRSTARLAACPNTFLHLDNFTHLKSYSSPKTDLIIFNLGFLPGAGKQISTAAEESSKAIALAYDALCSGGHLCIAVYPRHPGGQAELEAIDLLIEQNKWTHEKEVFETSDTLFWIAKNN